MKNFARFIGDDAGAITVDWIALTAGVLVVGITIVYAVFNTGVSSLVLNVNSNLVGQLAVVSPGAVENLNQ